MQDEFNVVKEQFNRFFGITNSIANELEATKESYHISKILFLHNSDIEQTFNEKFKEIFNAANDKGNYRSSIYSKVKNEVEIMQKYREQVCLNIHNSAIRVTGNENPSIIHAWFSSTEQGIL